MWYLESYHSLQIVLLTALSFGGKIAVVPYSCRTALLDQLLSSYANDSYMSGPNKW